MLLDGVAYFLSDNADKLIAIGVLIVTGVYLRILLEAFGQAWVRTKAHTATLMLLPIIVYVITSVISGNIALSLGMVGALSIVRFRNPVRSPLELSAYFCSITLGISAAVSLKWLVLLVGAVTLAIIVLALADVISSKFLKRPLFITSFSEGNSLSTLNINCHDEIDVLSTSGLLISKTKNEGMVHYTLASNDFSKLIELEKHSSVQKIAISTQLHK